MDCTPATLRPRRLLLLSCVALGALACDPNPPPPGEEDAGVVGQDAGTTGDDAGTNDAGMTGEDAGTEPPVPAPKLRAIDPLEPSLIVAGGGALILKVNGEDFVATSVVRLEGADRPTTFVDGATLLAALPGTDLAEPGAFTVTVFTAAAVGGGTSGPASLTIAAPAPVLAANALSPSTVIAGSAAVTLKVTGAGFVKSSSVRWNGAERMTTFVSANELHAPLSEADLAVAANVAVTVFTPAPGGGESAPAAFVVANPVPSLAASFPLTPASAETGGPAFSLTVKGAGFVPASTVRWNGASRTTSFVGATELVATIPSADLSTAGSAQVTVFNAGPGGGESMPEPFRIRQRRGAFVRVNLSDTGAQGNDLSFQPAVSATGRYVAFSSAATNLVPGDGWGADDVFVRDTCVGVPGCAPTTIRASVSPTGFDGFLSSFSPAISANGRLVVFTSSAPNLVLDDTNGFTDIFLRDTCLGLPSGCVAQTVRVSVDSNGLEANDDSDLAAVSETGRFVAFRSMASNLVAGDTNGSRDIFVRDTCIGATGVCAPQTVRASVSTAGVQGNAYSGTERPAISADGRYVAFSSYASNLLATVDGNAQSDVFLRDTCFNTTTFCAPSTTRVSVTDQGLEGTGSSTWPGLGADGRLVVFESTSSNLVAGDSNTATDIFIRDTCLGVASGCTPGTTRVSLTTGGAQANNGNMEPVITGDGRYVGWTTFASNLIPVSQGGVVRDTCRGATNCTPATTHVTIAAPNGTDPASVWTPLALTQDGMIAAWAAHQAGIVPNDTNNTRDVFLSYTGL